jgi:proline iminopeptidase
MKESSIQSGSVRVDGATLHYAIEGAGIPVLVIGSAIYYPRTFSHQLRAACRLIFADLRHFAVTDPSFNPDSITLDTYNLTDLQHADRDWQDDRTHRHLSWPLRQAGAE